MLIVHLALAKQVTCSPILLPLFHHPVSECSPSDGALRREPPGSPFFLVVRLGDDARTRRSSHDRKPVPAMSATRSRRDLLVCRNRPRRRRGRNLSPLGRLHRPVWGGRRSCASSFAPKERSGTASMD